MSGRAGRALAQAKINLALRVLGKLPDGYHSIETVFLRLELGDDVEVRSTGGKRSLKCYAMRDQPPEKNLAYRAAEIYAEETGWPKGFEVEIVKNIPIGGGLGGGSADAAAVLRILNKLSSKPLAPEKLLELAGRVGSDVPFLASGFVMALAWGRGEKMLELPPLPPRDVQLFVPPYGVPTGEAYALLAAERGAAPSRVPELTSEMFSDWESAAANSVNDFEGVVRKRRPEIDSWLKSGERFGLLCRMTGTGSTVFLVGGTTTLPPEAAQGLSFLALPLGARGITTRIATGVVPVEILD
ncbi:MAG: 4-(cytidine 5'-diphospho)-2-C-methyl-D-erythritol kinase [Gemmatimonadota bacterium]|nr:4-(cytidine 5'-diphospho)-2-C-methyl-D-erythritol kinase [Gemmatimonadota bacterium]